MDVTSYTVYEARWERAEIFDGQQYALAYRGDIGVLNSRFGPLPQNTSLIPQLERIRVEANERSERGLRCGDLIHVEYADGHARWWVYDAAPLIGGFTPVMRRVSLGRIEKGIARSHDALGSAATD